MSNCVPLGTSLLIGLGGLAGILLLLGLVLGLILLIKFLINNKLDLRPVPRIKVPKKEGSSLTSKVMPWVLVILMIALLYMVYQWATWVAS